MPALQSLYGQNALNTIFNFKLNCNYISLSCSSNPSPVSPTLKFMASFSFTVSHTHARARVHKYCNWALLWMLKESLRVSLFYKWDHRVFSVLYSLRLWADKIKGSKEFLLYLVTWKLKHIFLINKIITFWIFRKLRQGWYSWENGEVKLKDC